MKSFKTIAVFGLAVALAGAWSTGTMAAERKAPMKAAAKKEAPVETSNYEETSTETAHGSSKTLLGVGVASLDALPSSTAAAPSVIFQFSQGFSLQTFASITKTTGTFDFGLGALARKIVAGSNTAGVHVGGGVALGAVAEKFVVTIPALVGARFSIPSLDAVTFSIDAGPMLTILDGTAGFGMGGLSSLLGLSVHYLF